MTVPTIKVTYHHEDGLWWAEDFSGVNLTVGDVSLLETRRMVLEALSAALDTDAFRVLEDFDDVGGLPAAPAAAVG